MELTEKDIHSIGQILYHALLMATHAPAGRRMFERAKSPQPGDVVIEVSSLRETPVGIFEGVEVIDKDTKETAVLIERLDGTKQRWENADFFTVLPVEARNDIGGYLYPELRRKTFQEEWDGSPQ